MWRWSAECQRTTAGSHSITASIQTNRKQDRTLRRRSSAKAVSDLVLDPIAGDAEFSDRISNSLSRTRMAASIASRNFVADRQVLRREPAAHAIVLQVGVQSLGERVVLRRVTDEAGVVLDRLVQQRRQVINQPVWQAAAAQEFQRQATRPLQGPVVEDARPAVLAGLQTLRRAQVYVREHCLVKDRRA